MTPHTNADATLNGLRLLLVEDEAMVSMMLEDMLMDLGCEILGPAGSVTDALALVHSGEPVAAAILDVNVGGERIYPVAEALEARDVPFVFVTGYGAADIDTRFTGVPAIQKPFNMPTLKDALAGVVEARRKAPTKV